jgi:hypothetical protein
LPPLDGPLNQVIGEVCEEHDVEIEELEVMLDHVQRYGMCRSAVRHPSTNEAGRGTVLPALGSGISRAETQVAGVRDELLLLCDHWGPAPFRHQAVH